MARVFVLTRWQFTPEKRAVIETKYGRVVSVDTTSNSPTAWQRDLSPFHLGPCKLYGSYTARVMENAWQYSKVYWEFLSKKGGPNQEYWKWAAAGWGNPRAVRYPMGKGRKPEYSYWNGQLLDYVSARKTIYGPLYAEAVRQTAGWRGLVHLYQNSAVLVLLDYDAYDHRALGMDLCQVLNNPNKKMGHAFVLAMLLKNDPALKQMGLRK